MELWEALSIRRKEIGMQFDELQRKTGLSISTLKKILGGHVSAPSFDSVRAVAYAMDITMAELDRRIDGDAMQQEQPATVPVLSPEALNLARIYDELDPHSQRIVYTVATMESERTPEPALPKGIMPISALPFHNIPNIGTLNCTGELETRYAARQELAELESSPDITPVE